jgi:hypothetical protein
MPTYDPLQSYIWTTGTSTSSSSDYGSRSYLEHIRRQREQMARQEAAQRQQQMEMEARQRAEIDARVRDFQASLAENPIEWAQQQYENIPGPTVEEIRAHAQVHRGEPPTMIGFDTFRNQGRQIPYEPVNNLDPVINNPEKPGRSPF